MKHVWCHRQRATLVLLLIALALLAFSLGRPFWLDNSVMIGIFSLLALSVGLSYGQAGILSMATAAFASIGAFGTAILGTRYGISPWFGLGFAVLAPMLLAYPLARVLTRLSPLPLSIATFLVSGLVETAIREGGFHGWLRRPFRHSDYPRHRWGAGHAAAGLGRGSHRDVSLRESHGVRIRAGDPDSAP